MHTQQVRLRIAAGLAGLCMTLSAARSQDADTLRRNEELQRQAQAGLVERLRQQGFRPTRTAPLDQSLEDLLNAGHAIVAITQMATGVGLALRDSGGRRWVYCTLAPRPSATGPHDQDSMCLALN